MSTDSAADLCLDVQPMKKEDLSAETVMYQVIYSAAVKFIDDGRPSAPSVAAYFRSMLSTQNVRYNEEIRGESYRCVSWMPEFPLPIVGSSKVAQLCNALAKLFDRFSNKCSKRKSVYVVYLRPEPSYERAIHQYIIHKRMYKESTVNLAAYSTIAFSGTNDYWQADSELQILLEELTASLEQLTDTVRFETVSSVLFKCTQFPVVLIELSLEYCFCMLR